MSFLCFCLFYDRTELRQEAKWQKEGGGIKKGPSNSGRPKHNGAAHDAIGTKKKVLFLKLQIILAT